MFYETLIIIMKKNIWIWALAAATLVTACSKNDDPVTPEPEQTVTEDDFESPDGQVVIQLGAGDYTASASTTVTRAPLTNTTFANGNTIIGIYAVSTTGAWTEATNMLLNNRKAKVTTEERTAAQGADVSKKNPDGTPAVTGPYKISLYDTAGGNDGQVEYYPMISDKNYAFYGYGPYDATNNTAVTTTSGAAVAFNTFNGSQDIIWNKAEARTIAAGAIYESSGVETTSSISGYNAKYIRMLKYHRELNAANNSKENYPWVPNIGFTHRLTQLKFQVVPAEKQSTEDKTAAGKLFVKDIKIKSHGKPTLNIIDGTLITNGTDDLSMLGVTGGTTFTDDAAKTNFQPSSLGTTVGYLMLVPAASYQLEVTVIPPSQGNESTPDDTKAQTVSLTLKPATGTFEAGCSYNIKIGIYAMQEVEADASLTEWTDKGDVNIDVE